MVLQKLLLICSFGLGFCFALIIAALMLNASKCSRWEEEYNFDKPKKEDL